MSFSFSKPLALDILPGQQVSLLASLAADGQPEPTFSFTPPDPILHDRGKAAMMAEQCLLFEPLQVVKSESFRVRGLHHTLQDIENHISSCRLRHPSLRDLVFSGYFDGTTPMLLACHYGDLQWVKRLVDTFNVDINAPAVYYTTGHFICNKWEKFGIATPVFVATFKGHLNIVQYLVGKKADLSSKTASDNSSHDSLTPLQGAIFSGFKNLQDVISMVRFLLESGADPSPFCSDGFPMWMRSSHSAEITTLLINHGIILDQRNSNGETVLHRWAHLSSSSGIREKQDSMTVVELLVNRKADLTARDDKGFTPVLTAVSCFNWDVVFFLLERDGLDRMDRIEALEMTAATIFSTLDSQSYSASQLDRALECWRQALQLRELEPDPIPRTPLTLKSERTVEWITTVQLEQLIQDPSISSSIIKMQLFLARLSICSGKSWRALFSLYDSFENCVDYLKNRYSFEDLLDVLWATLETIYQFRSSGEEGLCLMVDKVIKNLLLVISIPPKDGSHFNTETFKKILEVLVATNPSHSFSIDIDFRHIHYMELLHSFVRLLASHPEIIDEEIKKLLWTLVAQDNRNHQRKTILHIACRYVDLPTIRLLLLSGADPNADDHEGNGPLHVLAFWIDDYKCVNSAAYYLLEYGACLEKQNKFGKTAADVWMDENMEEDVLSDEDELPYEDVFPDLPLPKMFHKPKTVPSLEILCARVIRSQRVPYNELPATLISMVELREELSEEVLN